jgi:UDP-N-acetylmuramate: L-alanyl-gamma-D-glutamyl-meso-diaminopimelate ligase
MYGNGPSLSINPGDFPPLARGARLHLIGVCGTGMSAAAKVLREAGFAVAGSDLRADPPTGPALAAWGIPVAIPYDAAHLEPAPDLVVVGNAVGRDNVESAAAVERALAVTHMPALMDRILGPARRRLVVAGTHGKSTTSALTAWLLSETGRDPGWLIGAVPNFGDAGRWGGEASPFVFEGDEYNAAWFDRGAKFFHYRPDALAITNVEFDHIDLYPDLEAIEAAFRRLIGEMPAGGTLVLAPEAERFAAAAPAHLEVHGLAALGFALIGSAADGASFVLRGREWRVPLPGRHGAVDAALAIELARAAGVTDDDALAVALAAYPGLRLRQERLLVGPPLTIVRDFGHHPTEVRVTLEGLRSSFPGHDVWLAFEPRSYTSRTARFQTAYAEALQADRVFLAPVFRPEALREPALDMPHLARALGPHALAAPDLASLGAALRSALAARPAAAPPLLLVFFSNGTFGGLPDALATEVRP